MFWNEDILWREESIMQHYLREDYTLHWRVSKVELVLLRPLYSGYSLISHHQKEIPIQYGKICSYLCLLWYIHICACAQKHVFIQKARFHNLYFCKKVPIHLSWTDEIILHQYFSKNGSTISFELLINFFLLACNHLSRNRNIQQFFSPFRKTEQKIGCNY